MLKRLGLFPVVQKPDVGGEQTLDARCALPMNLLKGASLS